MKLEGVITALITPFSSDGTIDFPALRALVEAQIQAGIHGLVACGTTAETPAMKHSESDQVIRAVVDQAAGRVPVIVGTGSNNTDATVEYTRNAKALGADAALVVTPYYNKPQQEGMKAHFRKVADEGGLPVIIYNIPPRCVVNLTPASILELAADPRFIGVKEAGGSCTQVRDIMIGAPDHFTVLSGDDGLCIPFWALGARGVVSVASNVIPDRMLEMWKLWQSGNVVGAAALDRRLAPLFFALFVETNPAPCKALAEHLGICTSHVRLPLSCATDATRQAVITAWQSI